MATRKEVGERRNLLRLEITEGFRLGTLRPGMLVPPVRELAMRHSLSKEIAHQEVQRLVSEGVLYTVPGSGTFFGQPPTNTHAFFLFVNDDSVLPDSIILGFAQRIAELGGATLVLSTEEARTRAIAGSLPRLAGAWDPNENSPMCLPWGASRGEVARVGFITHIEEPLYMDAVGFDDYDGGRQATHHLIRLGHKKIAYLGYHEIGGHVPQAVSWSQRREDGWRSLLCETGLPHEQLAFHPEGVFADEAQVRESVAENALAMMPSDVTAVVAANDALALTFIRALKDRGTPVAQWPAMVGFDNLASARGHLLTSFHLPFGKIGAVAADILWERFRGINQNPARVRRLVPMTLLPRMTSEHGWPLRMDGLPAMLLSTVT